MKTLKNTVNREFGDILLYAEQEQQVHRIARQWKRALTGSAPLDLAFWQDCCSQNQFPLVAGLQAKNAGAKNNENHKNLSQSEHPTEWDAPWFWAGVFYEHCQQTEKRQGVFYTPRLLARYVVKQTLNPLLEKASEAMERACQQAVFSPESSSFLRHRHIFEAEAHAISALRVLDPAAGCGIFLSETMRLLVSWYQHWQQQCALHPLLQSWASTLPESPAFHVLAHQVFGVELDPIAAWIGRWALLQQARFLGVDSECLQTSHLVNGNSLNRPETPDFSLEQAFGFSAGEWDVVLMNPPYTVEVRDNKALFQWVRHTSRLQGMYQPKMDLADGFLLLAMDLLKPKGRFGAVLPEYWLTRTQAEMTRRRWFAQMHPEELGIFPEKIWFSRAPGHHSSVMVARKHLEGEASSPAYPIQLTTPSLGSPEPGGFRFCQQTGRASYGKLEIINILECLEASQIPLVLPEWIQQGVVMPQPLFVLTDAQRQALALTNLEQKQLLPYYRPAQLRPWLGFEANVEAPQWLIYGERGFVENIALYPNLKRYLDAKAAENTSDHAPYGLHRPRQRHWFEPSDFSDGRIYALRQTQAPAFARVLGPAAVNEGFYVIQFKAEEDGLLMTALLNSPVFHFWAYHQKRKGHQLQVDKDVLKRFPRPSLWQNPAWRQAMRQCLQTPSTGALWPVVFEGYALTTEQQKTLEAFISAVCQA